MKTFILKTADNSVRINVQADCFASNAELQTAGFDTRFTNMEIKGYDDAAKAILNIREIEERYQGLVNAANTTPGIGLAVVDNNEAIDTTKVAQADDITLTGTGGTANVTVDEVAYLATWNTSLTQTAADFVTAHAAALSTAGITVTADTGVLSFVADVAGVAFAISIANATSDLAGTIANVALNQSGDGEVTLISPNHA